LIRIRRFRIKHSKINRDSERTVSEETFLPDNKSQIGKEEPDSLPPIDSSVTNPEWRELHLSGSLIKNLRILKAIFLNCSDVVFHEFTFPQNEGTRLAVVYVDGMTDSTKLGEQVICPLNGLALDEDIKSKIPDEKTLEYIKNSVLCTGEIAEINTIEIIVNMILSGETAILLDGADKALFTDIRGYPKRNIEESNIDRLIRGPRESFIEDLRTNTSLLRRKIKNPALKIEMLKIGRVTNTDVAVVYVEGITNPKIVAEVKRRIGRIDIDGILEGGYIEELIEDNPLSPFCTINHSDRVDKIAALLLEGRAAIIVDGTPFVMTAPALFIESIHNPEDYYQRFFFSSMVRILRTFTFFISISASSLFLSLLTYHPELLQTSLLLSIAAQREAVPFPSFIEIFIMEVVFEILREAGLRMPMPLGQAVSIVGSIVLGDAAVRAGLVTPATVIVVATAAIASFTYCYPGSIAIRPIRFGLLILSGFIGLPGLIFGMLLILIHMANLRSFGIPFLYPIAPLSLDELKDTFIRAPWWSMDKRPHLLTRNLFRQAPGQQPQPPQGATGG
jgi:spore germination protein KA